MLKLDGDKLEIPLPAFLSAEKVGDIVLAGAQAAVSKIKTRTRDGIGVDDKPMKTKSKTPNRWGTYSDSTSQRREKEGRNVDIRDLTRTGRMIQGVIVENVQVTENGATAFVTVANSEKEKAAYQQAMTPWFGLSPLDVELVESVITEELRKAVDSED